MVRVLVELQERIETEWKSMVSPCHEGNHLLSLCSYVEQPYDTVHSLSGHFNLYGHFGWSTQTYLVFLVVKDLS